MNYPLVVGNWKMNLSLSESLVLSGQVQKCAENVKHINIVICPPSPYIYPILDHLNARSSNIYLGLQNIMWKDEGPYTGEVSAKMIKKVCNFSIIGHSERRTHFSETDAMVAKKVRYSLDSSITPIVCIGESERLHLEDHYSSEIKKMSKSGGILDQIDKSLAKVNKSEISKIYFAYEPLWAIGTGNAATGVYASAISYTIRNYLKSKFKVEDEDVQILYGGSVDKGNVAEFMMQPNLNGLLVGGASLKGKEFCEICKITSEVKSGKKS